MNRRGFLGALIGAVVTDPDRLLWVPGKKLISIPAPVVLSEPLIVRPVLTMQMITREALRILEHNLQFSRDLTTCPPERRGEMIRTKYPEVWERRNVSARRNDTLSVPLVSL